MLWGTLTLILIACVSVASAQSLVVRAGSHLAFHASYDNQGRIGASQREPDPAVKDFFGNKPGALAQIGWRFYPGKFPAAIEMGAIVESSRLCNTQFGTEIVLGENLQILSMIPYITVGKAVNDRSYFYALGAVGRSIAKGTATAEMGVLARTAVEIEAYYKPAVVVRFGGGAEVNLVSNLSVDGEIFFDMRSFERDRIELFADGNRIGVDQPFGAKKLEDPALGIAIKLAWHMPLPGNSKERK